MKQGPYWWPTNTRCYSTQCNWCRDLVPRIC